MRGWRRDERRDRRDGDGRRRHRDDHHRLLHGRRVREGQSGRRGQQGRGRSAVRGIQLYYSRAQGTLRYSAIIA